MKKIAISFIILFSFIPAIFSQIPPGFNYQGVLRNRDGAVLKETSLAVKIEILKTDTAGTSVFSEIHDVTTNQFGVFDLVIGSVNDLSGIKWSNDNYFIRVSVDNSIIAVGKFSSVPYSLHAGYADSVKYLSFGSINGRPDFSAWDQNVMDDFEGDYNSLSGIPLTISAEQQQKLDSIKLDSSINLDRIINDISANSDKVSFPGFGNETGKAFMIIWSEIDNNVYYNSGNAGIAIDESSTFAGAELHVGGAIRYEGDPADTTAGLLFYNPAGPGFFCFYNDNKELQVLGATSVSLSVSNIINSEVVMHRRLAVGENSYPGYFFNENDLVFAENIIRLFFDDTSSAGSFPSADWAIEANGINEGNYFAIYDSSAMTRPFFIAAGTGKEVWTTDKDGNAGIGMKSTVKGLELSDTVKAINFTGNADQLSNLKGTPTDKIVNTGSTTVTSDSDSDNVGSVIMTISDTARMSISPGGEVTIGNAPPMNTLNVEGLAAVNRVSVEKDLNSAMMCYSLSYESISTSYLYNYPTEGKNVVFFNPDGVDVNMMTLVPGQPGQQITLINTSSVNRLIIYPYSIQVSAPVTLNQFESITIVNNGNYWVCAGKVDVL